jgi:cytochrome c554/c'-like protein
MRIRAVALVVGGLALASGLATLGRDEPARPVVAVAVAGTAAAPAPADLPANEPTKYLVDSNFCQSCHSNPQNYAKQKDRLLCKMDEYPQWNGKDKHKIAFAVLGDARAQQMGKLLKIKVTESSTCTNCHGTAGTSEAGEPFNKVENGVSCLACHGAYQEWVQRHILPADPRWRKNSRKEKEKLFGMTDLWDPVTRATKCASCHIGNADEQKVVTHAMYAAGHPPLPGLETATFSDAQPRHWDYLREKKPPIQQALGFNNVKHEQTELVAVSGIVALRGTMELYAAQARGNGLVREPETHWPDFARFDCYACHHDLHVKSWRQARGYSGTPGRPTTPTWPDVLVRLGLTIADPEGSKGRTAQFEQGVEAFHRALGRRPFGDRGGSAKAAQALADWADEVLQDLRGMIEDPKVVVVDGRLALRLLRQLCKMAEAKALDYDSARQIAMAFRTIYDESKAIDPKAVPDRAIGTLLDQLEEESHLRLPTAGTQTTIEKSFAARLAAVFEFNPDTFQARFAELASHLPPEH